MPTLTATAPRAEQGATYPLIEKLMQTEGKAEFVDGRIQTLPVTGFKPGFAADEIYAPLRLHARPTGNGVTVADGKGFLCDLPKRHSFSPDSALYTGPLADMSFFPEPPVCAVEVRSENDYGPKMKREMAAKRADYFATETLGV